MKQNERDVLTPGEKAVSSLIAIVVVAILFAAVIYLASPYLDVPSLTLSPH